MTRLEVETRARWAAAAALGALGETLGILRTALEDRAGRLMGIPPGVAERHELFTRHDD